MLACYALGLILVWQNVLTRLSMKHSFIVVGVSASLQRPTLFSVASSLLDAKALASFWLLMGSQDTYLEGQFVQ